MSSTPVEAETLERLIELLFELCNTADSEADLTGVDNSLDLAIVEELKCLGEISKLFRDTELFNT